MELLWLVDKDANKDIAVRFWLDGAGLSQLVKIRFQGLLYKVWLSQQGHSAGDLAIQSVAFP